jgi:hypothetical protein
MKSKAASPLRVLAVVVGSLLPILTMVWLLNDVKAVAAQPADTTSFQPVRIGQSAPLLQSSRQITVAVFRLIEDGPNRGDRFTEGICADGGCKCNKGETYYGCGEEGYPFDTNPIVGLDLEEYARGVLFNRHYHDLT